jgi:hypothetical protein
VPKQLLLLGDSSEVLKTQEPYCTACYDALMSHTPSSSSAGPSLRVTEPWQLIAQSGAGYLAVGLTLPVVAPVLTFASVAATEAEWGMWFAALRILNLAALALVLLGLTRLAAAPTVGAHHKWAAIGLLVAGELGTALPAALVGGRAPVLLLAAMQLGRLLGMWAIVDTCRRVEASLDDGGAWPLWNATLVLGLVASLTQLLPAALMDVDAMTTVVVSGVNSLLGLVGLVLMLVGVWRLRRRLA